MRITEFVGDSCAVAAIADLSYSAGPEAAVREFCRKTLGKRRPNYFTNAVGFYSKLTAFYIFSAGPEAGVYGNDWQRYGTEFAAFIKKHKLGKVATPGKFHNVRYHGNHNCQAWVWHPDQKALERWWEADQAKRPARRKRP